MSDVTQILMQIECGDLPAAELLMPRPLWPAFSNESRQIARGRGGKDS